MPDSANTRIGPEYGYLDTWISGYLDSGKDNVLLHPHSEVCVAALSGSFFPETQAPCVWQPEVVFLQFYRNDV